MHAGGVTGADLGRVVVTVAALALFLVVLGAMWRWNTRADRGARAAKRTLRDIRKSDPDTH